MACLPARLPAEWLNEGIWESRIVTCSLYYTERVRAVDTVKESDIVTEEDKSFSPGGALAPLPGHGYLMEWTSDLLKGSIYYVRA